MQIDRILGNVGVLYVGVYNPSTQYEYLNCVTYNGSSYVCVNQNGVTGVTPGTTNDWQLSAQKGDTGGQGIQGEQGIQGATGNGIQSIEKTSSNALTDTYTILFTDGSSTTFEVENGKGIVSIEKTSSEGNVDTYTITYNDDTTSTFTVINGEVTNEELQQALAQERVISDGKYSRALKTPVTDVESTQIYAENDVVDDLVINGVELTQVVTENSPSLDNPSEVQVASEQNIQVFKKNILNTNGIDKQSSGTTQKSKEDGGITISGTPTGTWISLIKQELKIPIKAGTKLYLSYGKTANLNRDNTFTPFVWLRNKKGTLFATLNNNNTSAYTLSDDLYSLTFGIEGFTIGDTYDEDIYIELEISDKQPTQFQKYEATDITIPLVNSAIGQYADTIDRENNVQNKVIQELTLTGDEDYYYSNVYNNIYQYNLNISNPSLSNDDFIVRAKSNYFKGIGRKNSWLYDNTVTTEAKKIRFMTSQYATVEDFKAKIKELYNAGTPVKVYYVAETPTTNPLSEEVQTALSNFKLYQDLNNIAIDNGSMSFAYNKSLSKTIEEMQDEIQSKDTLIQNLTTRVEALEKAQVDNVGGN